VIHSFVVAPYVAPLSVISPVRLWCGLQNGPRCFTEKAGYENRATNDYEKAGRQRLHSAEEA